MFRRHRLKYARKRFLETCDHLREAHAEWVRMGPLRRGCLGSLLFFSEESYISLHRDATAMKNVLMWLEESAPGKPLTETVIKEYHQRIRGSFVAPAAGADHVAPQSASLSPRPSMGLFGALSMALLAEHDPETLRDSPVGLEYRKLPLRILHSRAQAAPPARIPSLMRKLSERLEKAQERFDSMKPLDGVEVRECAVSTYLEIGGIRPFPEANWEVARLAMNHIMRRYRLPYIVFPLFTVKSDLHLAVEEADNGRPEGLYQLAHDCSIQI